MGSIAECTEASFEQDVLQSQQVVLLDFWGPTCGPCKALEPVLEQVAAAHPERLKVRKVNVSEQTNLAVRFAVRSLPTLLFLKGGKVVEQMVGRASLAAIEKTLARLL
ncbi:MAG: thioredoxin [Myxococcales bacterium]|nr:thioredoxin [Myxococcales bacterium]